MQPDSNTKPTRRGRSFQPGPEADDPRAHVAPFRRCLSFGVGRVVVTDGARSALAALREDAGRYLVRHKTGDWRETRADERAANALAASSGRGSILSTHTLRNGARLWVATTDDRSTTYIFVPEEAGVTIFNEREERTA